MADHESEEALLGSTGRVTSADGTSIGYRQLGQGPGLIILHGGLRASHHYMRLAQALADTYTVYLPDRRGRRLTHTTVEAYSVAKECEDLCALLQTTGAHMVFGHSAGGLIALEAALRLPIHKLVVYEVRLFRSAAPSRSTGFLHLNRRWLGASRSKPWLLFSEACA